MRRHAFVYVVGISSYEHTAEYNVSCFGEGFSEPRYIFVDYESKSDFLYCLQSITESLKFFLVECKSSRASKQPNIFKVLKVIRTAGPFVEVVGFSSGAAVAYTLVSLAERRAFPEFIQNFQIDLNVL